MDVMNCEMSGTQFFKKETKANQQAAQDRQKEKDKEHKGQKEEGQQAAPKRRRMNLKDAKAAVAQCAAEPCFS
eukprot:3180906-Pyramimonas_sp.AAC.1